MTEYEHEPSGYQLCLSFAELPAHLSAAQHIDLAVPALSLESALSSLTESRLTPADLRARALVYLDPATPARAAVLAYAVLSSYAGRFLDVLVGDRLLTADTLSQVARTLHRDRPQSVPALVIVGAVSAVDEVPSIVLDHPLTPLEAIDVRWARRLRFVPDLDPVAALSQFIVVAALRTREGTERFPFLCDGSEPIDPADLSAVVGVDLDDLRASALAHRRFTRVGDDDTLVEYEDPTERELLLERAAQVPVEATLARLGSHQNLETELWHCPRPQRHTHGDAVASTRVQDGRVRCYRCDAERIDSLRLTIDVTGLSVDEAADWLLSDELPPAPVLPVS